MNEQTIKNFMQICQKEGGSTLRAVCSYFVAVFTLPLDFPGAFATVKHFIKFPFEMKTSIETVLGSDYKVEVYNSLDFLDDWSYNKHAFELREGDELFKLDHIGQSTVVKLTSRRCCLTTVKVYSLWEGIYEGLAKEHNKILVSYKVFICELFPEVPVNMHFFSNFFQYFLQ